MDTLNNVVNLQSDWTDQLITMGTEFLPKLGVAILVWIIAWIAARLVSSAIKFAATKLGIDSLAEKANIGKFLRDAKFGSLSKILGKISYWIIYLFGINIAFNTLDLTVVSNLISQLIAYIPNLLVAVLIIVIGGFVANFVKDLINGAVRASKASIGTRAGQAGYIVVMFSTVMTALSQAQIDISFITDNINTIVMGICLALALAFGLGGKEKAKEIIEKMM